jgi:outer membrane protein assembly factor BamB
MTQAAALAAALSVLLILLSRRRLALLAGLVLLALSQAVLAAALVGRETFEEVARSGPQLAGILFGAVVVAALAIAFLRLPGVVPVAILAAAPFRVPISLGEQEAFLLIPLYAVLAAAAIALAVRLLRPEEVPHVPILLGGPVAAYVALASVSYLWTEDRAAGALELVFFLLPFTVLVVAIATSPREPWLPKALAGTLLALAGLFAAIGIWQAFTRELFFAPTLEVANSYTTFFRVTSIFRDPSLYGRHLVFAIALLLVLLLRGKLQFRFAAPAIAFFWVALYFSYSQSSMVALFVVAGGLALITGTRRTRVAILAAAATIAFLGGIALLATTSGSPIDKLTRGRSTLVSDTAGVFARKPLAGVGIGAQPRAAADEPERRASRARAVSHTAPLTVAAELGLVGLAVYLALLAAALGLVRAAWRAAPEVGLALGAAFATIFVQSLFYSGFFQDPLMWGSLALTALFAPQPARALVPPWRVGGRRPTRRQAVVAGGLALLLLLGLAAAAILRQREPAAGHLVRTATDVSLNTTDTGTVERPATAPPPPATAAPEPAPPRKPEGPCWKVFGGNAMRTLSRPGIRLGRPTKSVWARGLKDLMEYPPTYCNGRLFVNLNRGKTVALDAETGRVLWSRKASGLMASSPAIAGQRLIVSSHGGTVTALRQSDGKLLWELKTGSPMESSPVVVDRSVYVGAADGRLFALALRTGRVRWIYDTGGRISASPSVVGSRVCITTYSGGIFCLSRRDGHRIWARYVRRDAFRLESFYASPSTDGRRIFTVARTGHVVALSAQNGKLLWNQHMHALTYGTPSVSRGIVTVADLSGNIRAFRAGDGRELWRQRVGGRVLAPTVVIGGLVFFSTLEGRTFGAQTRTGRIVWSFDAGKYSPGIATERRYYFSLNGLLVAFRGENGPT